MQISRRTLLACATAAVLLPLGAFSGQDNPAQTKARQALDRMMQGLPPQPATQIQIPPAAATNRPVPVQPTPSMPMYPAPAPPPAMVPGTKTPPPPTAAKAKALEDALQQKMKETEEPQPAPPPPMAVPPAPAPQNPPSTQGGYTQPRPPIQPWLATPPPPQPAPPPPQPVSPPPLPAPPPEQIAPPPPQPMPSPEPVKAAPAFSKEEASGPEYQNVVLPKGSSPEDIQRAREALHETMPGVAEQANTRLGAPPALGRRRRCRSRRQWAPATPRMLKSRRPPRICPRCRRSRAHRPRFPPRRNNACRTCCSCIGWTGFHRKNTTRNGQKYWLNRSRTLSSPRMRASGGFLIGADLEV